MAANLPIETFTSFSVLPVNTKALRRHLVEGPRVEVPLVGGRRLSNPVPPQGPMGFPYAIGNLRLLGPGLGGPPGALPPIGFYAHATLLDEVSPEGELTFLGPDDCLIVSTVHMCYSTLEFQYPGDALDLSFSFVPLYLPFGSPDLFEDLCAFEFYSETPRGYLSYRQGCLTRDSPDALRRFKIQTLSYAEELAVRTDLRKVSLLGSSASEKIVVPQGWIFGEPVDHVYEVRIEHLESFKALFWPWHRSDSEAYYVPDELIDEVREKSRVLTFKTYDAYIQLTQEVDPAQRSAFARVLEELEGRPKGPKGAPPPKMSVPDIDDFRTFKLREHAYESTLGSSGSRTRIIGTFSLVAKRDIGSIYRADDCPEDRWLWAFPYDNPGFRHLGATITNPLAFSYNREELIMLPE